MGYAQSSDSDSPDTPAPAAAFLPARGGFARSVPLLDGDRGTAQTIALIRQVVAQGEADPTVNATVADILRGVPAYNDTAAARAIFEWVLGNIRFTNNPVGHEMVRAPAWTITHGIGDCNNINAELLPSMLMSIGIPVRLVTVGNDPSDAQSFTHIYAEANLDGTWTPLDAARPGASFGTAVSRYTRKRVWSLVENRYVDMRGLSGVRFALGDDITAADLQASATPGDFVGPGDPSFIGPVLPFYPTPTGAPIPSAGAGSWLSSFVTSILKPIAAAGGAPTMKPPVAQTSAAPGGSSAGTLLPLGLLAVAGFALIGGTSGGRK